MISAGRTFGQPETRSIAGTIGQDPSPGCALGVFGGVGRPGTAFSGLQGGRGEGRSPGFCTVCRTPDNASYQAYTNSEAAFAGKKQGFY